MWTDQFSPTAATAAGFFSAWPKLHCCRKFFAASPMLPRGIVFSNNLDLFRWVHINHAVVANSSATLGFDMSRSTKSRKEPWAASTRFTQLKSIHHIAFTASQSYRACFVSSAVLPQWWHVGFARNFLFIKFTLVGKLSEQAFHKKCLIFPGTFEFPNPRPLARDSTSGWTRGYFTSWIFIYKLVTRFHKVDSIFSPWSIERIWLSRCT